MLLPACLNQILLTSSNMIHSLFTAIDDFDNWAQTMSDRPQDERGGEWECDYRHWGIVYDAFETFIQTSNPATWTADEKERLLYILARDNESEILAKMVSTNEHALTALTEYAIVHGHREDKWQLAVQLHTLNDKNMAIQLLEQLVMAEDEYVNRLSLMELAKLGASSVEHHCELFWNRHIYLDEDEEYQRMAVLTALKEINSSQLGYYLELAKKDGRKYLVRAADIYGRDT